MPTYRTPGVYFEWLDARDRAIVPLRTDIAGFVGITERGPIHRPVRIESWTQFVSVFGRQIPQAYLAYAVEGFFANGGRACWIVRVADPNAARPAARHLLDENGNAVLLLTAGCGVPEPRVAASGEDESEPERERAQRRADPGLWGQALRVVVSRFGTERFALELSLPDGARELWYDLSLDSGDQRYVERILNDPRAGSRLVTVTEVPPDSSGRTLAAGLFYLTGGDDGLATLRVEHFTGTSDIPVSHWGLAGLALVDEVSIVAMPDILAKPATRPSYTTPPLADCRALGAGPELRLPRAADPTAINSVRPPPPAFDRDQVLFMQLVLVGHCQALRDRVAVLDPRLEDGSQQAVIRWRNEFDTSYAALYYPWVMVPDPLRLDGLLRAVPPSGHIAGIYARGDLNIGVHKPPANEALEGVLDTGDGYAGLLWAAPERFGDAPGVIDDIAHGELNDHHINVIRAYPGRGVRVMGARTLSSELFWRYINVRRLLTMIEEALDERTQWIVFEPHNTDLRSEVTRVVRGLLDDLWQRGMLDGATPEEAYSIACDDGTNQPEDVELGRVICEITLRPPWPAEFVIVRLGRVADRVGIIL